MSADNPPPTTDKKPKPSGKKPKKTSSAAKKAEAMFNDSAAPMSVEKFFQQFETASRNNVDFTFDPDVQDRIAAPYVQRAQDHATYKLKLPEDTTLAKSAYSLISVNMIRKMVIATPQSSDYEIASLKNFKNQEVFGPRAAITAIDSIGKVELNDYVCRIKYSTQDILRLILRTFQVCDGHPRMTIPPPIPVNWNVIKEGRKPEWSELDLTEFVSDSNASARWIRDQARSYLDKAYEKEWEIKDGDDSYLVTYPRLQISTNLENQQRNVYEWVKKLHPKMPDIKVILASGLCTIFQKEWFSSRALKQVLPPDYPPELIELFPNVKELLKQVNISMLKFEQFEEPLLLMLQHLQSIQPQLVEMFNMTKQPSNEFGSAAQFMHYRGADLRSTTMLGLGDVKYNIFRGEVAGRSFTKLADKGLATSGLIFGFSTKTEVGENYIGKVSGDPNHLRYQYLKSDFRL